MTSRSVSAGTDSDRHPSPPARVDVGMFHQPAPIVKPPRCNNCRISHTKCDAAKPECGTCVKYNRTCEYPTVPPRRPSGRMRAPRTNRITTACLVCRKGKRKCDGGSPTCGPCLDRRLTCEYDKFRAPFPTLNSRHRTSSAAERPAKLPRLSLSSSILRHLQHNPQVTSRADGNSTQRTSGLTGLNAPEVGESSDNDSSHSSETNERPLSSSRFPRPSLGQSLHSLPAKANERPLSPPRFPRPSLDQSLHRRQHREPTRNSSIESLDPTGRPRLEHRGRISLPAKLKEAVLHRTDESNPGHTRQSEEELVRLNQLRQNKSGLVKVRPDMKDITLPSREVADRFLASYLTREFVNLPIFHLPTFQEKYVEIWSSSDLLDDMGVFRGILNAIFALGCLASDPNSRNDATMYFIKAQRLIRLGSLEGDNLTTVQAYIIVSQYLIAINDHAAAWKSIGIAIRVAETLRLHLKSGTHHLKDRVDRELARRIWYSCILLERMIALSLGSSTIVTPRTFQATLPMPLDNEYVDSIFGGQPIPGGDRPSIVEFLVSLSRLYERYEDIVSIQQDLRSLYGSPTKALEIFDCQPLLNADRKLCNWVSALPQFLRPDADPATLQNAIAKRQNNILRIRYLYLRLLLWRPLLALTAASPDLNPHPAALSEQEAVRFSLDKPLIYKIASQGAVRCILSAHEILKILSNSRHRDGRLDHLGPIPSWWENIEYLYTCGLIFLAGHSCPINVHTDLPSGSSTVEDGLQLCIQLLDQYRSFSREAGEYLTAIESLVTTLAKSKEGAVNGDTVAISANDMTWLESSPQDLPL